MGEIPVFAPKSRYLQVFVLDFIKIILKFQIFHGDASKC